MILVDVAIAGPAGDVISLLLKKLNDSGSAYEPWEPGGGDERWFVATGPTKNEILATALAAITAGKRVYVDISNIQEGMPIQAMRLTHHFTHIVPGK